MLLLQEMAAAALHTPGCVKCGKTYRDAQALAVHEVYCYKPEPDAGVNGSTSSGAGLPFDNADDAESDSSVSCKRQQSIGHSVIIDTIMLSIGPFYEFCVYSWLHSNKEILPILCFF